MARFDELLLRAESSGDLSAGELASLLETRDPEQLRLLFAAAYRVKSREVGRVVRLRGLVELGNVCIKNCLYCGIRRGNPEPHRYTLSLDEIVADAELAAQFGYGSVVLQGGERRDDGFADFIEEAITRIKRIDGGALGITLSLGEQSDEVFRRWFAAGAHRYLLRIEASDPEFYARLHPGDELHSYARRVEALYAIRAAGFQLGTGVMIGLPGQNAGHLAGDIAFFKRLDVDMIGMGPYIPHPGTPLELGDWEFDPERQLSLGLKMIALTRLVMRDVNIAATTALQTLAADGRERGLLAGANVIMPNVGALEHRRDYFLYAGKPGSDENAAESRAKLTASLRRIGERVGLNQWGDSPHFAKRRK